MIPMETSSTTATERIVSVMPFVCACGARNRKPGGRRGATTFQEHDRLRSERKDLDTARCPGSDGQYAIKRNLWFGGQVLTNVFSCASTILTEPKGRCVGRSPCHWRLPCVWL